MHLEVLKLGGVESEDAAFLASLAADLSASPRSCVIVHGGGKRISELCERLGLPVRFSGGLRCTPPEVMEVAEWILGAAVNGRVCRALAAGGVGCVPVRGCDGILLAGPHEDATLGCVGRVRRVEPGLLLRLLSAGLVPVLAPLALGPEGTLFNINADHAAVAVALALGAARLDFVSGVPGVLVGDGEVIPTLGRDEVNALVADGTIRDGMVPKVEAALRARESGVPNVTIRGVLGETGTVFQKEVLA